MFEPLTTSLAFRVVPSRHIEDVKTLYLKSFWNLTIDNCFCREWFSSEQSGLNEFEFSHHWRFVTAQDFS